MKAFRSASALAAASLVCLLAPVAAAAPPVPRTSEEAAAPVAVEQAAIGEPGRQMAIGIWHPAGARADGAAQRLPLVVISHGTGAGPLAHVDTAQALADAGFVVAAPMHRGDNFADESGVGRPEWMAGRARDVSETIDFMTGQWPGKADLDPERIGIFGFSAGATTALISIGGVLDIGRAASHCATEPEFVCRLLAPPTEGGAEAAPRSIHDPRIGAAVVAAPGLGFAFGPDGLDAVKVPVQLWSGADDRIVPYATNAGLVRRQLHNRVEAHEVENAVHLSFLAPCGPESPPPLCEDNPGFDRAAFHRTFNGAVADFFRLHLPDGQVSRPSGGRPRSQGRER